MRAASLTGPKRFEFVEADVPLLQDGQILVRLQRVSICGSDLRFYDRVFPEEQYPLDAGRPCHECAGVVEESRCDEYQPGQRVIVLPPPPPAWWSTWPSRQRGSSLSPTRETCLPC